MWIGFKQKQARSVQKKIRGPIPGQGMQVPSHGPLTRDTGLFTPFAQEDPFNGPGRDSERFLQAQSATPLNRFLSDLVPDQDRIQHYRHAHRIKNTPQHYFPKSPWWPNRYAPFLAPNAYTSLRQINMVTAPPAYQRTAGGLEIAAANVPISNVNTQLAKMYANMKAPTSFNKGSLR